MKSKRSLLALAAVVVVAVLAALAFFGASDRQPATPPGSSADSAGGTGASSGSRPPAFAPSAASIAANPLAGTAHSTPISRLPEGRVRDYLPGLLQKASGPNPSADFALLAYQALSTCKSLATWAAEAAAAGRAPTPIQNAPDCQGISAGDWDHAQRLLKLAADLGNERAQLEYATKAPLEGKKLEYFIQNPEELVEFKNNANRYLAMATEAGSLDGMWLMSEYLRTGDLMRQDFVAAYQYKYAISLAGGYPQTINGEVSRLESQLTPQEVESARANANRFLARCCKGAAPH